MQKIICYVIRLTFINGNYMLFCSKIVRQKNKQSNMNIREIINDPATILVDVRTPSEFLSGNVPGSINIPLDEVPDRVEEFKAMQGTIIVCCVSGGRSGQAAAFLGMHGVNNIYNGGGWMDVSYLKSLAA
jgi:rhodanese-related sulfurtransferase